MPMDSMIYQDILDENEALDFLASLESGFMPTYENGKLEKIKYRIF